MAPPLGVRKATQTNTLIVHQNSRLLDLPTELRLNIYSQLHDTTQSNVNIALCHKKVYRAAWSPFPDAPALLQTCKQLHAEVKDKLYEKTVFTINVHNAIWNVGPVNKVLFQGAEVLHLVRHVNLQITYDGLLRERSAEKMLDIYKMILGMYCPQITSSYAATLNHAGTFPNDESLENTTDRPMTLLPGLLRANRQLETFSMYPILENVSGATTQDVMNEFERTQRRNSIAAGGCQGKGDKLGLAYRMLFKLTTALEKEEASRRPSRPSKPTWK